MTNNAEAGVTLSEPLFRVLEAVVMKLQQCRADGWITCLGDVQNDLHGELAKIQQELDQREAERDRRIDALQRLVDGLLATDKLQAALVRVHELETALDIAQCEAARLRAIVQSSWAGKLWKMVLRTAYE
jgi:hypothetical protein